jgi:tRNA (guanine10-N2)-dimethyltransferase
MSYIYHLAGENLELAEAELKGFLKSQDCNEIPLREGRIAETNSEPSQLKRLALTHEVSRKICEKNIADIEDLEIDYRPERSFAVRVEDLDDKRDKEEIENVLGKLFSSSGNSVDLENPETIIKAYLIDGNVVIGELVESINRGLYDIRKNQHRPFSSPVSLDPVLARALINLSCVNPGEKVLDPFCGTGGILIEAGLCGSKVRGLDIKEEMCKGCITNLEEYGIINHGIRQGKISEIDEIFEEESKKIITDLPYGKSSKQTEDAVESFLEFIESFDGKVVFVWNEKSIGGYTADFSVYVHRSLSRHIYVVEGGEK